MKAFPVSQQVLAPQERAILGRIGNNDGAFDWNVTMLAVIFNTLTKSTYSAERVRARTRSSLAACSFAWSLAILSFALTAEMAAHFRLILLEAAKPGTRESAICCKSFNGASHLSKACLMAG